MKFTQQQLEEAYKQMQDERQEDGKTAYNAITWLHQNLGMPRCNCHLSEKYWNGFTSSLPSPYKINYKLVLVHETYGPYLQDYYDVLDKLSFVTKKGDVYEATTPFGTYEIAFEYFDNHCTGY